jgi:putative membrane protein
LKRDRLAIFLKGVGMGAADAVPGVSGGTIAFVTGIYEQLIYTIRQFGPSAWRAWRLGGVKGLYTHLNLAFLLPLLAGVAASLVSVAHLALWLMDAHPLLLDGFFFGLVAASALVVHNAMSSWKLWYLLPLVVGLLLAKALPGLMPTVLLLGNENLVVMVAGAIAISAMLLPGVSGSFLLLTMGLYGTIMQAIRGFDLAVIGLFGIGCLIGLALFSRLLAWLFKRQHDATMQLLLGFIVGSLPVLWPWRELVGYQLGPDGQIIPLAFRYLMPSEYAVLIGDSAQLGTVILLMLLGAILVVGLNYRAHKSSPSLSRDQSGANKE